MVVKAPRFDPVIVSWGELKIYSRVLDEFGDGAAIKGGSGTLVRNRQHVWYSRPEKSLLTSLMGKGVDAVEWVWG